VLLKIAFSADLSRADLEKMLESDNDFIEVIRSYEKLICCLELYSENLLAKDFPFYSSMKKWFRYT